MALTGDKRAEFDTVTAKYIFVKNGAGDYVVSLGAAVLAWLLRELSMMSSGQAYVSIAWGVYGVILLIVGLRLNRTRLTATAIGTLLLVVGKLFLVDLAELEAIWRVLLFLGFGGGFLVLSYYFQDLWKREPEATE